MDQVTGPEQRMSANLALIITKCRLKSKPQPLDKRKSRRTILEIDEEKS